jgi:hypothetical protein
MAPPGGWQARLSAWQRHVGTVVVRALAWLPGWAAAVLLAAAAGLLVWRALGQVGWLGDSSSETDGIDFQEDSDEHQDPQAVRPSTAARDRQT